jgi:type I restriction enzyme S subunit
VAYSNGSFTPTDTAYYLRLKDHLSDDLKFWFYYLPLLGLEKLNTHSAVPGLSREIAYLIEVDPPSKETQQKIAAVLSSLDAKIELNNRINTELESMAKTLYDYWFVQFDFPDVNGKPYKSSGGKMVYNDMLKLEIPDGWIDGTASDMFYFNPSLFLPKNKIASYIDMNSLPLAGFMTKRPERKIFNGGVKFQNGDVAIARITPCLENGKTGLITLLEKDEVGFGSTEFIIVRGKSHALSGFAAYLGRSDSFRQFAISNMTGTSGRKRIDAKVLETYSLAIPSKTILERFECTVESFFKQMTKNSKESEELTQLRDWLLPMLMNGQIRVN